MAVYRSLCRSSAVELGASEFTQNPCQVRLEVDEVYVPPHMTAGVLASVPPTVLGRYRLDARAHSAAGPAQAATDAYLTIGQDLTYQLYLPLVQRSP